LIEVYQNIVGACFLRHRPSRHYCCYGNHAAGSKPILKLFNLIELSIK